MALRYIRKEGDPILLKKAVEVNIFSSHLLQLLDDMIETMFQAEGVGLAAPQVGISKRIIVYRDGDVIREIINPVIVKKQGEAVEVEGCLSLPGVLGEVPRSDYVEVKGLNRRQEPLYIRAQDMLARILQHEIDHLDGLLFIEKAIKVFSYQDIEKLGEER